MGIGKLFQFTEAFQMWSAEIWLVCVFGGVEFRVRVRARREGF